MSQNKTEKNSKNELVLSGKILPEVEHRMIKGERINVIIGKADDLVYIDPKTKKVVSAEDLERKNIKP